MTSYRLRTKSLYISSCHPLLPPSHSTAKSFHLNFFFCSRTQLVCISLRGENFPVPSHSSEPSLTPPIELAVDKRDVVVGGDAGSRLGLDDRDSGGEEAAISSKAVVEELYRALERGDADAVGRMLNPDLDWWFHGPRAHQHRVLMRLLTGAGAATGDGLPFKVRSVDAFGATVLAEGTDAATGALYWVHAWTVGPGGRVTGVREYCNTALVVTRLGGGADAATKAVCSQSQQVWQSRLPDGARRNLPGLVLAI